MLASKLEETRFYQEVKEEGRQEGLKEEGRYVLAHRQSQRSSNAYSPVVVANCQNQCSSQSTPFPWNRSRH